MFKILKIFILLGIIVVPVYYFRADFSDMLKKADDGLFYRPCAEPIAYRIGGVDARFGLSEADFLTAVKEAESLWDMAFGRDLLGFDPAGKLAISLAYDYRQKTTEKLDSIEGNLAVGKSAYEKLKADYAARLKEYNDKDALIGAKTDVYNKAASAYEKEVLRYNRTGGAPPAAYETLMAKRAELDRELEAIRAEQAEVNELVGRVNELARALNKLISDYNLNVKQYNTVGESLPDEYEQGNYTGSLEGGEITIFQYSSREKLIRVLAHEFGHALGIDHLSDPEDIMYSLNVGANDKISPADISALKEICATPTGWENIVARAKGLLSR